MGPSVFVPCSWHVKYFFFTVFPLFNVFSELDSFFFKLLYHLCLFPSAGNEKKTQSSPSTVISWACFTSGQARSKWRFGSIFFLLQSARIFAYELLFSQRTSLCVFFAEFCFVFKKKRAEKRGQRRLFSFVQNRNKRKRLSSFVSWKSMKRYKA